MKFVVVDGDQESRTNMERSLKCVYESAEIVAFTDALSTYQYCIHHAREIAIVFLSVMLKPIDGFKLRELISSIPIPLGIVFTMRDESKELVGLVRANGEGQYIVKPVTPSKIVALTKEMVDRCWADDDDCKTCRYFWCGKWKGESNP